METPKFLQIATIPGFENQESSIVSEPKVIALGQDGNVYMWHGAEEGWAILLK